MNLFDPIIYLFKIIFYQPMLNVLVLFYLYVPGYDFGIAIILLTILIRIILHPLLSESIRVQKITNDLQPKIKEIQEKHKHDKEKQAILQMELFKENNVNIFSGFFIALLQLPILTAIYQVFLHGLESGTLHYLYPFVRHPETINPLFLNWINLSKPSPIMVIAAGILQFFQSKMLYPSSSKISNKTTKDNKQTAAFAAAQQQMLYIMPIFTIIIFWNFPAAMSLYWIMNSICAIIQQKMILRKLNIPKLSNQTNSK